MSDRTKIEWTDTTWNPVTGCERVSSGCDHCYAARIAHRLQFRSEKYHNEFLPTWHMDELERPDHWRKPRRVFVCSMGDLFHRKIPAAFIQEVFQTMARNERHIFQVLTKRPSRAYALTHVASLAWPRNVWLGVSVESEAFMSRILDLVRIPAFIRFVSFEPLLSSVPSITSGLLLEHLDWVIVGGETGPGARPMPEGEPRKIRDACIERGIPFFFKRWGDAYPDRGRELDGRGWEQFPEQEVT